MKTPTIKAPFPVGSRIRAPREHSEGVVLGVHDSFVWVLFDEPDAWPVTYDAGDLEAAT